MISNLFLYPNLKCATAPQKRPIKTKKHQLDLLYLPSPICLITKAESSPSSSSSSSPYQADDDDEDGDDAKRRCNSSASRTTPLYNFNGRAVAVPPNHVGIESFVNTRVTCSLTSLTSDTKIIRLFVRASNKGATARHTKKLNQNNPQTLVNTYIHTRVHKDTDKREKQNRCEVTYHHKANVDS